MVCLRLYKALFDLENWVYPFMVVPITMSINYVLVSKLFAEQTRGAAYSFLMILP